METLSILLLTGFAFRTTSAQLLPPDEMWVERTLGDMTLEEKIGRLLVPVHSNMDRMKEWTSEYNIGGIWFA
jgi:hypothetical protein